MAEASPRRTSPWVAFAAGVVATLAFVLLWWAFSASRRTAETLELSAPTSLAELPSPNLPEAPRLPDAPVPIPR